MAKLPVFDTSIFSSHKKKVEKDIAFALLSSIVLYELTATATDWWETAKAIRRLYNKRTFPVSKLKTLQNDALIARLSVKNHGFVVTMDVDDYEIIKREMPKLEVVSADYFFS